MAGQQRAHWAVLEEGRIVLGRSAAALDCSSCCAVRAAGQPHHLEASAVPQCARQARRPTRYSPIGRRVRAAEVLGGIEATHRQAVDRVLLPDADGDDAACGGVDVGIHHAEPARRIARDVELRTGQTRQVSGDSPLPSALPVIRPYARSSSATRAASTTSKP